MFSPWMVRERANVYLYRSRKSFLAGEFSPPPWSNGIAYYDRKLVAVYDQPSRKKLIEVVSHEMTHLLFESYWGEVHKAPPQWLNEGLAMMEENDNPEKSEWYRAMAYLRPDHLIPLYKLVQIAPTSDLKDKDIVSLWYVEAYSLVFFLYKVYPHSRIQFFNFCSKMRDGKTFETALWTIYRYQNVDMLEDAWKAWLKMPSGGGFRPRVSASLSEPFMGDLANGGRRRLAPIGFGDFGSRKEKK